MPNLLSKCGYVINLSEGTSEYELTLVPDRRIEEIGDLLDGAERVAGGQFYDLIDELGITAYRCPNCGRLYLESKDNQNHFTSYAPEP